LVQLLWPGKNYPDKYKNIHTDRIILPGSTGSEVNVIA
jgi:hypothetical protein